MGHRHFFGPSYTLETENDQNWSLPENTYMHTADNMSIDGTQYTHCNHTPNYQQDVAGPSDRSMHTYIAPNDYRNQASSSNYNLNPFNEEDFFDVNGRVQYKRKSPGVPEGSGSSSEVLHYHTTNPNGLSIGGESSVRNVRSRSTFDFETDTRLANSLSREYYTTSRPMDVSPSIDLVGQSSNVELIRAQKCGVAFKDNNTSLNYESNPFLEPSQPNNNPATISNHVLQSFASTSPQSVRGVRSNYSQRLGSTFRVSSTNLRLGDPTVTDERLQLAANNYSSRYSRPSSTRARMLSDRYRSFSGLNLHDRPPSEGLMIVDRSAFYGSRNPFDHHRDMRLDIDDMSYEELLALGERIGSVETGVPGHLISKCMQESIYCSSDQIQEEGKCVICLEEYANMDDIGMLKACGHDFHVECIKKWLSMKNVCPVCKAEPMKHK